MMKLKIEDINRDISIAQEEFRDIVSFISWKKTPHFFYPGRVAWQELKTPAVFNNSLFYGVKLKGIGVWNPRHLVNYENIKNQSFIETPTPPILSSYDYSRNVPHVGVSPDAQFKTKFGEATPLGGMTFERARNEFENALLLFKSGVSAAAPLLTAQYTDLSFNAKLLGCVVSIIPDRFPCRVDTILYKSIIDDEIEVEYNKKVASSFEMNLESSTDRLLLLNSIFFLYGQELRRFSSSGLYRHSGGINNIYLNLKEKRVVFTDLDSSMQLRALNDKARALEILRDLASLLYKVVYRHLNPKALKLYDFNLLQKNDHFIHVLKGYFPDSSSLLLTSISSGLWKYTEPIYQNVFATKDSDKEIFEKRQVFFDKDLFFCLCIYLAAIAYRENKINKLYPLCFSDSDLINMVQVFLDESKFRIFEKVALK